MSPCSPSGGRSSAARSGAAAARPREAPGPVRGTPASQTIPISHFQRVRISIPDVVGSKAGAIGMRRWGVRRFTLLLVLRPCRGRAAAQSSRQIRVSVEFRQTSEQSRDAVQGGGGVIITERGSAQPRAGVGAESTQRRVQRSSGVFTLVQDGGESLMTVATQVPYQQIGRSTATTRPASAYLAGGVSFQEVGHVAQGPGQSARRQPGARPAHPAHQLCRRRRVGRDRLHGGGDRAGRAERAPGGAGRRHVRFPQRDAARSWASRASARPARAPSCSRRRRSSARLRQQRRSPASPSRRSAPPAGRRRAAR